MEDNGVKIIFFAVSILVTMATFSLVMLYYNSAKTIADSIGDRADIGVAYDAIITDKDKLKQKMTGVEVRQLIRKYAGDVNVEINIYSISNVLCRAYNTAAFIPDLVNAGMYKNINNNWIDEETGMLSEMYLSIIDPSWRNNEAEKQVNGNKIKITLKLDEGLY